MEDTDQKCTIGFIPDTIIENGGILPLLANNGVRILKAIAYAANVLTEKTGMANQQTKYGYVRNRFARLFDTKESKTIGDIDLADFLDDLKTYALPTDRMPRKLIFVCPISGHEFTVIKKGKLEARISAIDGKSVYDSFTREEVIRIREESIFSKIGSMFCKITYERQPRWNIVCTPIEED